MEGQDTVTPQDEAAILTGLNQAAADLDAERGKVPAPQPAASVPAVQATVATGQTQEEPKKTQEQPAIPQVSATTPVQVETRVVEPQIDQSALAEIARKKGTSDPGKIAKMYLDLEKEYTKQRQEAARVDRQTPHQPYVAPDPNYDPQEFVRQKLNENPLGVIQFLVDQGITQKMGGLEQGVKDLMLHNAVVKLSSSPDTAYFNLPEVQGEITSVLKERGWVDNIPSHIDDAFDIAYSRLARAGKLPNIGTYEKGMEDARNAATAKQGSAMASATAPTPPNKPINAWDASTQDAQILQEIQRLLVTETNK